MNMLSGTFIYRLYASRGVMESSAPVGHFEFLTHLPTYLPTTTHPGKAAKLSSEREL